MTSLLSKAIIKRTYNDIFVFPFLPLHLIFIYIHVSAVTLNVSLGGRCSCKFNSEDDRGEHNDQERICWAVWTGCEYTLGRGKQGSGIKGGQSIHPPLLAEETSP